MAAAMGFASSIFRPSSFSGRPIKHSTHRFPATRSPQLQPARIKNKVCAMWMKKSIERNVHRACIFFSKNLISDTGSFSPGQKIILLYSAINDRDLKNLDGLIAEDCSFEDYTFMTPFQGRKEVLRFLRQLVSCMGQNMRFNIEHICEGNDYTATVDWHIDWNEMQVPFTRGCTCYSFSIYGDELLIKKARVLVESPIKLGAVALTSFKIVSSLFDAFPAATEWFLKSPHIVFHVAAKVYGVVVKPIICPFLEWYVKVLNVAASLLAFTLKLLLYLAKIFHML
ncbi:uncharacterized protein LOC127250118 [Andrographis paniculata]|uniref:uncharacterized protein LOC127250118 n=1 Tax=Andrographis paniculata TaxID=175694 RepID=UPI0021E74F89|nr:uncharacterized protein LOC127250118 [Andrographis paniculata]